MLTESQVTVVGNPRLDIYRRGKPNDFFKRNGARNPLKIGIAFSATSTSQCFGPPHHAEVYHDHIREDYVFPIVPPGRSMEDILWRDHAILKNMMWAIKRIGHDSPYEMILRPSPLEGISEYPFLEKRYPGRMKVRFKETLPEFLSNIDVLLTCWSTTGIEALLNEIPVIGINGLMDRDRLFDHIAEAPSGFNDFVEHYHSPSTLDDLMGLLSLANENKLAPSPKPPEETEKMINRIYGWSEDQPRVCALIADDIAEDLESLNAPEAKGKSCQKALSLRYNMPPILAEYGIHARDLYKAMRSGEFHSYMSFLRCHDPHVDRLIRKVI